MDAGQNGEHQDGNTNVAGQKEEQHVRPKYTGKRGGSRRFEGWTRDRIITYNRLCRQIVNDRGSHLGEQFEIEFLGYMKEKKSNKRQRCAESNMDRRPLRAWREDDSNDVLNVQERNSQVDGSIE
jgi:hypothetical protein